MLKDITLGQYYQTDSVLHRMDPRTKLIGIMVFVISLFIFRNALAFAVVAVFLFLAMWLSKVPFSYMVRGMKGIMFLLMVTVIFNLFLTPGIPLVQFWKLQITDEGLRNAIFTAIRLIFLILGGSLLTLTTTPNNLTDGLESLMKPLKLFRIPVHEVAMMMSIALRFIPILLEETDKIMKAQMARGADFEHGGIIARAKSMIPILVPLFVSAFRRANDLAMAMEARCYRGGDGRTKMKPLKYNSRDILAFLTMAVYIAAVIVLGSLGESLRFFNIMQSLSGRVPS
ncbi:MAG: energy-coupling factor transporter transmembrane protein EcfT [Lachnospiraceae bacterium]|nr:energy-coupling factor transporter transmembrane protein EcfT [Lachnospiraceae bacterium]